MRIEEIVERNIELMQGNKVGQMQHLLFRESMGGNAGTWRGFSCVAANFFYDSNGEIKYFGNWHVVSGGIRLKNYHGTFRLAVDTNKTWKNKIVNFISQEDSPDSAKEALKATKDAYNNRFAFNPEA